MNSNFEDRLRAALRSPESSNAIARRFDVQLQPVRRMRAAIIKKDMCENGVLRAPKLREN